MEDGGEHESHAGFCNAPLDALGLQVDFHAQGFQHVGAAAGAGGGPVAVFCDLESSGGGYEGGGRGYVEGILPVAAGAHGVHHWSVHANLGGLLAHHLGETRQFFDGLSPYPQRGEEGGQLGGRRLAVHDLPHNRRGPHPW